MDQNQQTLDVQAQPDNEPNEQLIEQLKVWLGQLIKAHSLASSRKERLEELMRRKSAKKWDAAKTARMVRRLVTANQEIEQAEETLEQVKHRLQLNGIEIDIRPRSSEAA